MNWYIGQPIVAIINYSAGEFKKGEEFIIKGLQICVCKQHFSIDVGKKTDGQLLCTRPGIVFNSSGVFWFRESCFAPLDVDISELTEILERELINKE